MNPLIAPSILGELSSISKPWLPLKTVSKLEQLGDRYERVSRLESMEDQREERDWEIEPKLEGGQGEDHSMAVG